MISTCDICDKKGEGTHHSESYVGECFICDKCAADDCVAFLQNDKTDGEELEECKKCGTSLEKDFCISCDGEEFPFGLSGHEISGA